MSRLLLVTLLFVSYAAQARAQGVGDIACRVYPPTTESYKKKLWDGYEISLGPARNATGAGEDQCTAAIYYYCVTRMELHKKDNPRVVGAELVRWFGEA